MTEAGTGAVQGNEGKLWPWDKGELGKGMMSSEQKYKKTVLAAAFE